MSLRLRNFVRETFAVGALGFGIASCSGGSGAPVAPVRALGTAGTAGAGFVPGPAVGTYPPASAGHVYVGASNSSSNGGVIAIAQPLTASSIASAVLDDRNSYAGLAVNPAGRMFAAIGTGATSSVEAFALPLIASSAPLFPIAAQGLTSDAFDAAGDLVAARASCGCIAFYAPPLATNAVPAYEYSLPGVTSLAVSEQRVFATFGPNDVEVLDPPYVAPTLDSSLGGIPVQDEIGAQTIDPHGSLIVAADYEDTSGMLAVYRLPLAGTTTAPSVSLALSGAPTGFAIDRQGRLVISVENCLSCDIPGMDSLVVYDLPLTAASVPVLTYALSTSYDVLGNVVAGP